MKGLIAVVLGVVGLFSAVFMDFLPNSYRGMLLFTAIIPLLISILAVYIGVKSRQGGARIWGIIAITLGVIGTMSHALQLLGFGN